MILTLCFDLPRTFIILQNQKYNKVDEKETNKFEFFTCMSKGRARQQRGCENGSDGPFLFHFLSFLRQSSCSSHFYFLLSFLFILFN